MSDKFLAVVKLNTGEEVIAKIDIAPELDVIALDCPSNDRTLIFYSKAWN